MSGGVDSSVATLLLWQRGYRVEGLFMKNWEEDDRDNYCSAAVDLADAEKICRRLSIPLHTVNFSAEYWDQVFSRFLLEYRAGRTPNPDVVCNKEIKFKAFLDHALGLGADYIATGHYARLDRRNGSIYMLRGADVAKDQTYFLYGLGQRELAHSLFPIGDLDKTTVRQIARQTGFENHSKKDSTGICFIGERKFSDFLATYLPSQPGPIETANGVRVGKHDGLMFYTLGQRKGLGIGGRTDGPAEPWYVIDKNMERNALIVAQGHDHPRLFRTSLEAEQPSWIEGTAPELPMHCTAKVRYRQEDQPCELQRDDSGLLKVEFDRPVWAITPGQSVVFYQGPTCLGGAIIREFTKN
jgi:tRNA-specific 2-thiouridylase